MGSLWGSYSSGHKGNLGMKEQIKGMLIDKGYWRHCLRLRNAFFRSANWQKRRESSLAFYSRFISRNDLCFDIGANRGHVTRSLRECGARVVSVEPQQELAAALNEWYAKDKAVLVECSAVGDAEGFEDFYLGSNDTVSSLSLDWIQAAKEEGRMPGVTWAEPIRVPVVTIQTLITRYGNPRFIKVDVEGYENKVLSGLEYAPGYLEFEATRVNSNVAISVVEHINSLGQYQFNIFPIHGREELVFQEWVDGEEMLKMLHDWTGGLGSSSLCEKKANIFARNGDSNQK